MYSGAKKRASDKGLAFTISLEDIDNLILRQEDRCALSGVKLNWEWVKMGKRVCPPDRASLDRKDSSEGYTPDNVQLVTDIVNRCKNMYAESEFLEMCQQVTETNITLKTGTHK